MGGQRQRRPKIEKSGGRNLVRRAALAKFVSLEQDLLLATATAAFCKSCEMSEAATEALGGAIGSCLAFGFTYPLVSISTWAALRTSSSAEDVQQGHRLLKLVPSPLRELIWHASQPDGLTKLYAGIQPFLAGTAISQGLYFYLYSALRQGVVAAKHMAQKEGGGKFVPAASARTEDIGVLGSVVVASLAGAINAAITHPVWVVVTQMQQAARTRSSDDQSDEPQLTAWERAVKIYCEQGPKGFWKGLVPALLMVANPTIQFILYEWLVARVLAFKRKRAAAVGSRSQVKLSPTDAFLLSALGKLGATLATYPMLLIKSRMQASTSSSEQQYSSVWESIMRIIRQEGVAGLFKGMKAKMLQTVLGAALLMAIKEQVYNSIRALRAAAAGPRAAALLIAAVK